MNINVSGPEVSDGESEEEDSGSSSDEMYLSGSLRSSKKTKTNEQGSFLDEIYQDKSNSLSPTSSLLRSMAPPDYDNFRGRSSAVVSKKKDSEPQENSVGVFINIPGCERSGSPVSLDSVDGKYNGIILVLSNLYCLLCDLCIKFVVYTNQDLIQLVSLDKSISQAVSNGFCASSLTRCRFFSLL